MKMLYTEPMFVLSKADGQAPPQGVRSACARGLKLVPEYGGDGLTAGAKARARSMANGGSVSMANIKRMKAFFARHTYAKTANPPSPGYVAYLLWGGAAGKAWANKMARGDDANKSFCLPASLAKGGEGSRGGRVIGHTRSGHPIYAGVKGTSARYKHFTAEDHADAALAHNNDHTSVSALVDSVTHDHKPVSRADRQKAADTHFDKYRSMTNAKLRQDAAVGHVPFGHTRSGKEVHLDRPAGHSSYRKFTAEDHEDASKLHAAHAKKQTQEGNHGWAGHQLDHEMGHIKQAIKKVKSRMVDNPHVGRTQSGKHVMDQDASHAEYKGFSRRDHLDAADAHLLRHKDAMAAGKHEAASAHLAHAQAHLAASSGTNAAKKSMFFINEGRP